MSDKYMLELDEIEFNWLYRLIHQQFECYNRSFDFARDETHKVFIDGLLNKFRSKIYE